MLKFLNFIVRFLYELQKNYRFDEKKCIELIANLTDISIESIVKMILSSNFIGVLFDNDNNIQSLNGLRQFQSIHNSVFLICRDLAKLVLVNEGILEEIENCADWINKFEGKIIEKADKYKVNLEPLIRKI